MKLRRVGAVNERGADRSEAEAPNPLGATEARKFTSAWEAPPDADVGVARLVSRTASSATPAEQAVLLQQSKQCYSRVWRHFPQ